MYTGTTSYLPKSTACVTARAVDKETSCSADFPPYTKASFFLIFLPHDPFVFDTSVYHVLTVIMNTFPKFRQPNTLSPTTPAMMKDKNRNFSALRFSRKKNMPINTLPAAPIPVQTA